MSAIAAIVERTGAPADRRALDAMIAALAPHGPEWSQITGHGSAAFGYAHRTDVPEAHFDVQPLVHEPSGTTFLFDGRLDNRDELADRLGFRASERSRQADSEIARDCWLRWGENALNEWVGEYALVYFDASTRRLIAATDPFGRRCLSYRLTASRLVLASMPKGVLAHPDVPHRLNVRKLAEAAGRMYLVQDETFFEGVARLPAGMVLTVDPSTDRVRRYYDVRARIRPIRYRRDGDYVEAASELLSQSVKAMLRSAGPVGAFLSGGLDSSTVAVEAADQLARQGTSLPTFTAVPEAGWDGRVSSNAYGDETPFVKAIAALNSDIQPNFVDGVGLPLSHGARDYFAAADAPFPAYNNAHWYALIGQEAHTQGITTLLEGEFGNMTLSRRGDDLYLELLRSGRLGAFAREGRARDRGAVPRSGREIANGLLRWAMLSRLPGALYRARRFLRRQTAAQLLRSPVRVEALDRFGSLTRAEARLGGPIERPHGTDRDMWVSMLMHHLSATAGELNQGFSAQHGVEKRDPFSNRRLVEWSLGLPADQLTRNGQARWLISRMMVGRLPDAVIYKDRHIGRQAADWHLKFTRDLTEMRAALSWAERHPLLADVFDGPALRTALERWPERTPIQKEDATPDVFALPGVHQAITFAEWAMNG